MPERFEWEGAPSAERVEGLFRDAMNPGEVPVFDARGALEFVAPWVRALTVEEAEADLVPLLKRHAARLYSADPGSAGPALLPEGSSLYAFPAGDPRLPFARLGEIHIRWMIRALLERMELREPGAFARYYDHQVASHFGAFCREVNGQPRTAVFVASRMDYKPLREAIALRRRGYRTFFLCLDAPPDKVLAIFEESFDGMLRLPLIPELLGALVRQLRPEFFEVHCAMMHYHLGRVVLDQAGDALVGCAFNDITSFFLHRQVMVDFWCLDQVDLDVAMERHVCNHADLVTHQWDPGIEAVWRERFGGPEQALEMQPYPLPEWTPGTLPKASARDGVLRMVWAGQVPGRLSCPPAIFDSYYLGEAFEALLAQGFGVEAFQNPMFCEDFEEANLRYYSDLGRKFERFKIRPGVRVDRLGRELAGFDFGLVLFEIDFSRSNATAAKNTYMLTNKLFAYLEAGIPVIVNREYEKMAQFVTGNGFGLALGSKEIASAAGRIRDFDRAAAGARIAAYAREHAMDVEIGRLLDGYAQARRRRNDRTGRSGAPCRT